MHRGASNPAPSVKPLAIAELRLATAHLEGGYSNTRRSCLATKPLMSLNTPANSHKNRGTQHDRHIDDLPNMKTLSLGNSDATDQGTSGHPQPETVDPAEKILPVSQTVVHINVYISEAPLVGGARIIHKVPTSAPETRPIATQDVYTMGPTGTALGSPVACAVGQERRLHVGTEGAAVDACAEVAMSFHRSRSGSCVGWVPAVCLHDAWQVTKVDSGCCQWFN